MNARGATYGLVLVVAMAGCASQPAGSDATAQPAAAAPASGAALHQDGFESGAAEVQEGTDQPEVSREGFEAGVTSTEIPVPTPTPPPGDLAHSSR